MVTRIRSGLPPSTFEQSAWARSSARQAEASLLASSRTSPSAVAQAARAQPIIPLPATAGRLYPSEPVTHGGYYHAPGAIGLVGPRAYPAQMAQSERRHGPTSAAASMAATFVVAVMMLGRGLDVDGDPVRVDLDRVEGLALPSSPPAAPTWWSSSGIVCSIIAMAWVLSRLNRLYVRITGSAKLPTRYLPAWRKSLSDERPSPRA